MRRSTPVNRRSLAHPIWSDQSKGSPPAQPASRAGVPRRGRCRSAQRRRAAPTNSRSLRDRGFDCRFGRDGTGLPFYYRHRDGIKPGPGEFDRPLREFINRCWKEQTRKPGAAKYHKINNAGVFWLCTCRSTVAATASPLSSAAVFYLAHMCHTVESSGTGDTLQNPLQRPPAASQGRG